VKKCSITFDFFLFLFPIFLYGCGYLPNLIFTKDPLTAEEHNNLGVAYQEEGKYELALREYKRALDKDSSLIIPLVNIGNVYFKQGKYKDAEEYYLKAIKKDEESIEAANNLASLYIELGKNYEKGLDYLSKAIMSIEDVPAYALDTLGVLYLRLDYKGKAKETLLKACERVGDDKALMEEIEVHLKEMGEEGCGNKDIEETDYL